MVISTSPSRDADEVAGIDRPPEILRVRAAHAFGQAGGAGGVEDRERVARLDRVRRQARLRRREGQAAEAVERFLAFLRRPATGFRAEQRPRSSGATTGANSRSITISRAPQLLRMCSSCAPREATLMGTAMAPSQPQPNIVSSSSARLPHMMATRSPGLMPAAAERSGVPGGGFACLGVGERHAADRDEPALPVALGLALQHPRHGALRRRKELLERQGLCSAGRRGREYRHDHPSWRELHWSGMSFS